MDYRVRYRPHGRVLFFNFPLAKEMGLVKTEAPDVLEKALETAILETFSLQIINEYDLQQHNKIPLEFGSPKRLHGYALPADAACKQARQNIRRRQEYLEWMFKK